MKSVVRSLVAACLICSAAQAIPAAAQIPHPAPEACKNDGAATFEAITDVQKVAEAYALDAVDMAKEAFNKKLDWTDESVSTVEDILAALYKDRLKEKPTDEQVLMIAKMFGSYIGEVYRRNYGASWGIVTMGKDTIPGLQTKGCGLFWPWGKVNNRLENGAEDNVWHYYQALLVPKVS